MAERALATAFVNIVPGTVDLERYLKGQLQNDVGGAGVAAGDKLAKGTAQGFGSKIKGYFAPIAASFAASFAAFGVVNFFKDSTAAASNFAESANAVNVAYGKAAPQIAKLGEDAATRLGLSSRAFNEIATRFSGFADTIAGSSGDVAQVIDDLSTRGADFASVFNIDVNDALTLFQSGLAGETEPLRRYGIDLSAAAVENFALAKGIAEKGKKLTEDQKVQARYLLLMEETSKVQGDFANTSDGMANQQRIFAAQLEETQKKLGNALLPAMTVLATFANDVLIPAMNTFIEILVGVGTWISENIATVATFVGVLGGLLIFFNRATIAVKIYTAVQAILNAVMAANPMTLLAIAIAAVVAGIVYLATKTTFFQDAWKAMTKFVSDAWNNVTKFLSDSWNNITSFFSDAVKNIQNFFKTGWDNIVKFFRGALDTIVQLFLNWTVLGWIIKNWNNIVEFFQTAWQRITGFFRDALDGIVRTVSTGISNVINFFRDLPGKILNAIGNLGKSLYSLGQDMIQGLLDGAGSLLKDVGSFFLNMLPSWIRDPFKKALGIASPSKVFKEFGKNIIDGLLGGIREELTPIQQTMKDVRDKVVGLFEDKKISKAARRDVDELINVYEDMLTGTQKLLDNVNAKLEAAQQDLEDRIRERQDFIDQIARQYGSAGLNLSPNLAEGEKSVADQLRERIARTKELTGLTKQLQALGLDKNLIRQIVEAQAVDFAKSIVAGGKAAVDELNVLASEADRAAKELATGVGDILFAQGIEFAKSVVAGLKDRQQELESLMKQIAKAFAAELQAILKAGMIDAKSGASGSGSGGGSGPGGNGGGGSGGTSTKKLENVVQQSIGNVSSYIDSLTKAQKNAINSQSKSVAAIADAVKGTRVVATAGTGKRVAMASGGFVNRPTNALIGEAGPEVVYPLKDFERAMGITGGGTKTIHYYAAPNQSLDSEQALFQAMKRAKVISGW